MPKGKGEKPTAELFLRNIQAERSGRPWFDNWNYPWERDWLRDWWNPYAEAPARGEGALDVLFSRKEAVGAIVYNAATKAVFKVNDSGYKLLLALQAGGRVEDVGRDLGLSKEEIEVFLRMLTS